MLGLRCNEQSSRVQTCRALRLYAPKFAASVESGNALLPSGRSARNVPRYPGGTSSNTRQMQDLSKFRMSFAPGEQASPAALSRSDHEGWCFTSSAPSRGNSEAWTRHWLGSRNSACPRPLAVYNSASMVNSQTVALRLPPDDLALLDTLAEHEERSRSDVIRRALRAYARSIGVAPKPARKRK